MIRTTCKEQTKIQAVEFMSVFDQASVKKWNLVNLKFCDFSAQTGKRPQERNNLGIGMGSPCSLHDKNLQKKIRNCKSMILFIEINAKIFHDKNYLDP